MGPDAPEPTASPEARLAARVDGRAITMAAVDATAARGDVDFETARERLIDQAVLAVAAEATGLDAEAAVAARLRDAREKILGRALIEQHIAETVTPEAVRTLFEEQAALRAPVTEVRASHILSADRDSADAVAERLAAGDDFAALARLASEDAETKDAGGDLGWFTADALDPQLTSAAFSTPPGEISDPVQTARGWHVVRVADRRAAAAKTFDELESEITDFLRAQEVAALVETLRAGVRIETYEVDP